VLKLDFDNVDSSGRDVYVKELIAYINKSPLIGNGLDFGALHHGHNTYLSIIADAGIFPLLLFLFLLIKYAKNTFLLDKENKYYAFAILQGFILFMLSLQTVINQPYLIVIFIYLAYYIDLNAKKSQLI
jgi:O-antigen ligase